MTPGLPYGSNRRTKNVASNEVDQDLREITHIFRWAFNRHPP